MICGENKQMNKLDQILISLLEIDILDGMRLICESSTDWWLISHIIDLLIKCGCKMLTIDDNDKSQIAEYLLIEYGASLMTNERFVYDYFLILFLFEFMANRC